MARKIFVAATGQNCGKTTVCLGLLHLAQKKYRRVGFIKPVGPKPALLEGRSMDKDAALMARVFDLQQHLEDMSPVVLQPHTTREVIDGKLDPRPFGERIVAACARLEEECDLLIIEGSGHPGVGSVLGLSNARIARMLEAPVLLVTGGGIGNVIDNTALDAALFEKEGVELRAVLANKLIPEKRDSNLDYLRRALAGAPYQVLGGFNFQPILANPTLRRIAKITGLEISGHRQEDHRIIHHLQIGAPSTQRVAELLQENTLVIVTSSRDELLVTLANLYQFPEYHSKIVGLLIPGVQPVGKITQKILDWSEIPYLRAEKLTTADLYGIITRDVSKLTAEDAEKLDLIRRLAELRFDFEALDALFA